MNETEDDPKDTPQQTAQSTAQDIATDYFRFETASAFRSAFDRLLTQDGRELRLFDGDLSSYGFNAPQRIQALRDFLAVSRARRLYIAVHDTEHITRDCPRLITLLGQFTHAMQIHRTHEEIRELTDSFAVMDKHHYVRRPVGRFYRGAAGFHDEPQAIIMRQRFAEIWDASYPGVSASTLGL